LERWFEKEVSKLNNARKQNQIIFQVILKKFTNTIGKVGKTF